MEKIETGDTTKALPHSHKALRKWIIFAVFHALIPLVALSFYAYLGQREIAVNTAKKDAEYVSGVAANVYQEKIRATKSILRTISALPQITGRQAEPCNLTLAGFLKEFPSYADFGATDKNGVIYCSGLPFSQKVDVKDTSWYQETLKNEGFSAGLYQIGKITRQESVNFGYPVALAYPLKRDGKISSVVFAALRLDWIKEMVDNFKLPEGSTITVTDREGTILAHFPRGVNLIGTSQKDNLLVKKILEGDEKGSSLATGFDGVERYYSYIKIQETLSNAEFYLYIGIPESVLTQAANKTFATNFVIILSVVILTAAVALINWKLFINKNPTST